YIHAEGYPAAEMKHGPIALVDDQLPVVFVATRDAYHEKLVSNIQEIHARKGNVLAVVSEGDNSVAGLAQAEMVVARAPEVVASLLSVIPGTLLWYSVGVARGLEVDTPRTLAWSATVE